MRLIDPIELKRSIAVSSMLHDGKTLEQIIDEQPTIEERKWITCSERLPDNTGLYLITIKLLDMSGKWRGDVTVGARNFNTNKRSWFGVKQDDVLAWMPLPDAFEVDE